MNRERKVWRKTKDGDSRDLWFLKPHFGVATGISQTQVGVSGALLALFGAFVMDGFISEARVYLHSEP